MTRRLSSLLVIAPLALSLTACADEDEPPPEDATQAEVVAMTAPVESALASPTGVVAADSMCRRARPPVAIFRFGSA